MADAVLEDAALEVEAAGVDALDVLDDEELELHPAASAAITATDTAPAPMRARLILDMVFQILSRERHAGRCPLNARPARLKQNVLRTADLIRIYLSQ
jgi:hypothetical protein